MTNNLQVQDVYSIRGLAPGTAYDLKVAVEYILQCSGVHCNEYRKVNRKVELNNSYGAVQSRAVSDFSRVYIRVNIYYFTLQ